VAGDEKPRRVRPYWDEDPWPEAVSGTAVLDNARELVQRHITTGDEEVDALILWAVGTWAVKPYDYFPGLVVTSPEKQCGKTRLMEVVGMLTHRPILTIDASMATLYRAVEEDGATIFIDEIDRIKNRERREDLTRMLNGSTSRAFGWVERCETVGRRIERRSFSVFGPKACAGIGVDSVPDTFRDRSLHIELQRRAKPQARNKLRHDKDAFGRMRQRIARWADDHLEKLGNPAEFPFPEYTSERHEEAWEPLLEIAQVVSGPWPDRAWSAMEKLTKPIETTESWRVALLRDCQQVYRTLGDGDGNIARDQLRLELLNLDEPSRAWKTWGKGAPAAPLTSEAMRKVLSKYEIRTTEVWINGAKQRGYKWDDFFDAWESYLGL
jgi:putative DNA primase/helicase